MLAHCVGAHSRPMSQSCLKVLYNPDSPTPFISTVMRSPSSLRRPRYSINALGMGSSLASSTRCHSRSLPPQQHQQPLLCSPPSSEATDTHSHHLSAEAMAAALPISPSPEWTCPPEHLRSCSDAQCMLFGSTGHNGCHRSCTYEPSVCHSLRK